MSEVEKTLLYISEARERAGRARAKLEGDGAEPHLISALEATEQALADDHRKLMQGTFFAVPSSDQERLAVWRSGQRPNLLNDQVRARR